MACAVRTFTISTDVVGTTNTINDLGFDPDFLIIMINGQTNTVDNDSRGSAMLSIGVASSSGTRRCVAMKMQDNVATSATDRAMQEACVVQAITDAGGGDGQLDVDAWLSGGVRFIVDQQFATAYTAVVLFVSGITASFVTVTDDGVTGDHSITGLGDNLEAVLVMNCSGGGVSASPYLQAGSGLHFGAAANLGGSIQTATLGTIAQEADPSPNSRGFCKSSVCYFGFPSSIATPDQVGTITARISNGVTLNVTTAKTNRRSFFIGLKGIPIRVATLSTKTNTTTTFGSGSLGFSPLGGLVLSASRAEDTTNPTVDAAGSIGFWDQNMACNALAWMYKDASGPSVCGTSFGANDVYVNMNATANASEGRATMSSVTSDSVNFIMNEADTGALFAWSLIFGDNSSSDSPKYWRWRF